MSVTQFPAAGAEPDGSDGWGSPAPGDRTPPQDNDAEQSVLGAMLLSKDAIADVIETVRGLDFYRPAHETLFDAILDLYGRGEPADAVTVAAELQRRGELTRVGGAPYLHTLVAGVPIAANANYYAEIVREKAILRRLVDVGTKIAQLGYGGQGQVDDVVDRAQAEVYGVTERRASEDFAPLSEIIPATLEEIEAIEGHDGTLVGVPTGFTDLDALTNGLHPGQMVIVAARPSAGKSTLALDLCRSASLRHGLASVIFSLEMNRTEITMRLLSAEAKIALHSMRNGKMNEDDWARLARRMAEVSEAPLFIDDSPNMTMMEIRAKARRLKQRHDLRLVVVDYLQLMTSGRRVESRQVEVSEFSRQMKLLAKELEVPVVAVSQLNRGAEQRTDKRPLLSDLRESGCLIASTRLLRADNGAEVTLGELLTEKSRDVSVWSLDDRLKLVPRTLTHAFPSGSKPTYRVRLASGREVDATANHPFLTLDGWTRLDRLAVADRVGVLRHAPAPLEVTRWSDDHVVRTARGAARHQGLPASVFGLPKRQVALFVRHLWAPYGSIDWDGVNNEARIRCGWPSRRLADDVARLLLRLNVLSHIAERPGRNGRPVWQLSVPGIDNQKRFCDEVWAPGTAGRWVLHVQRMLADVEPTTDLVTIPPDVWARVVDALRAPVGGGTQARALHPSGPSSPASAEGAGRTRLASVAAVLDDSAVDVVATNDVFWDEIVAVEELGEQPVFDATVLGTHNFVANGIALHNSLEQDADLVILLHREDMYERESTRPGEADVIVAKHRAGPTSTVVVSFQGHFARFVDMARM